MLVAMAIAGVLMQGCFAEQPQEVTLRPMQPSPMPRLSGMGTPPSVLMQNVNSQRASDGATELMLAAKTGGRSGYWKIVDLLSAGARVYIKDKRGKTALEWAIDGNKDFTTDLILDRLLRAGSIDWAVVDAACDYAAKAGAGAIVDYLSGKEISDMVPGEFFLKPGLMYAMYVRPIEKITLKLPAREVTVTVSATSFAPSSQSSDRVERLKDAIMQKTKQLEDLKAQDAAILKQREDIIEVEGGKREYWQALRKRTNCRRAIEQAQRELDSLQEKLQSLQQRPSEQTIIP